MHLTSVAVPRFGNVAHLADFTSFSAWWASALASPEQPDASGRQICSVVSSASFSTLSFYQKQWRFQVGSISVWIDPNFASGKDWGLCDSNFQSFWPWSVSLVGSSII